MSLSRDAVVLLRRPRMVSGTLPQLSTSVRVGVRANVTLGIPAGRAIYGRMGVDDLLDTPASTRSPACKSNFVATAATNRKKKRIGRRTDAHALRHRPGLRERLKISPFL